MLLDALSYKPDFIRKIFDLDIPGKYAYKAQRYQHIIKFFLSDENHSFKITEVQDILFKVPELFNVDISKNSSDIKKNQNRQFNKYLQELETWKLITSSPAKSIKGETITKEYRLLKFGKTIALIIEFIFSEKKQENYSKLFDYWKTYLNDQSTSIDLFCLVYLNKCKESGLFNEFADFFINSIIYRNQFIRNNNELFTQMILVKFNDKQTNQILLDLWKKSFEELDEKNQELFLNHMSIHINRMILSKVHDFAKYELKRYKQRHLIDCIISEFYCCYCTSFFDYIEITVFSYVSYFFGHPDNILKRTLDNLKCKNCKETKFEMVVLQ